ncbi:MAG: ribosome maturation factor RimP [Clostridia bacterium]|nr:ribosome maturation factor RimP [Clostridia bacterium]
MNVKPIAEIRALLEEIAAPMGVEIVDVEFKQGKNPALTVYADTEKGIDLDTCEAFHRAIDEPLDELDPTYGVPYTLNVSSPGLDRPLKTERDFERVKGGKVEVKLYAPVKGKKFFEGELTAYDENSVTIVTNEKGKAEEYKFNRTQIAKINRAIEFD